MNTQRNYHLLEDMVNRTLASLFLIILWPLFLIISLLIKLEQPSAPIFYRGKRLGKNKQVFYIYKFRTLKNGAEHRIGDELLPKNNDLVTRTGRFLRPTRLDELPQFINVLKGEMDLVGPRPIRPMVFEKLRAENRNLDDHKFFSVKPGIFGVNQFFTPYHTPSIIRYRFHLRYMTAKSIKYDISLTFYIISRMCHILVKEIKRFVWDGSFSMTNGIRNERRQCQRINIPANVSLVGKGDGIPTNHISLFDINDSALSLLSDYSMEIGKAYKVKVSLSDGQAKPIQVKPFYINADGKVISSRKNAVHTPAGNNGHNGYSYLNVIQFENISHFNYYKLEKYILRNSLDAR